MCYAPKSPPKNTYKTIPYRQSHKSIMGATLKRATFCALLVKALTPHDLCGLAAFFPPVVP
jgi:hypothetical protein